MFDGQIGGDCIGDGFQIIALQNALPHIQRHARGDVVDDHHRHRHLAAEILMNVIERSHIHQNHQTAGLTVALHVLGDLPGDGFRRDVERHIKGFIHGLF